MNRKKHYNLPTVKEANKDNSCPKCSSKNTKQLCTLYISFGEDEIRICNECGTYHYIFH